MTKGTANTLDDPDDQHPVIDGQTDALELLQEGEVS
jgi:hypothetical protein